MGDKSSPAKQGGCVRKPSRISNMLKGMMGAFLGGEAGKVKNTEANDTYM